MYRGNRRRRRQILKGSDTRLGRGRKLFAPEQLEVRAAPGGGLLETFLALTLYWPWEHDTPDAEQSGFPAVDEFQLNITIARPVGDEYFADDENPLSASNLAASSTREARLADACRDLVAQQIARAARQALGADGDLSEQDWLAVPGVDELAEALAAGGQYGFGLAPRGMGAGGFSLLREDDYNNPPVASQDYSGAWHDQTVSWSAPGVLGNDYDPDSDPLTAVLISGPSHAASFQLNSNGSFTYVPPAHTSLGDWFTYAAFDGQDYSEPTTVEVMIYNIPAFANDDLYGTQHDMPLDIGALFGVLANDQSDDGDPLTATLEDEPEHAAFFDLDADGSFIYEPQANWAGSDVFTYWADDGVDSSPSLGTVAIQVTNQIPIVLNDPDTGAYATVIGTPLEVDAPGVRSNDSDADGDPFEIFVKTQPAHGSVTLDQDGSFRYVPESDYEGDDTFQYYADDHIDDGVDNSLYPATVYVSMQRPIPDIDTDSDNNGTIEEDAYEDGEEMKDPGRLLKWNTDDDNTDGVEDRLQAPLRNAGGQAVMDDDLFPAVLSWNPLETDMTGCVLELSASSNLRLWRTRDKEALPQSYTVGTDTVPAGVFVEGYDVGQGTVTWTVKNPLGAVVNSDVVKFTVAYVNMTAYRPQTDPFARTEVPQGQKQNPGAGIRRNGDDDNTSSAPDRQETGVAGENDLIEVALDTRPASSPGIKYVLARSDAAINVWQGPTKTGPLLVTQDRVDLPSGVTTTWVEWQSMDPEDTAADYSLIVADATHNSDVFQDSVHLYPFTSIVIALGGEDQVPTDPPDGNHGTFQVAQFLYRAGYDVHMYDEDVVDGTENNVGLGAAYEEVVIAVSDRNQLNVAILGYSHGGGSTHDLAWRIATEQDYSVAFTSYVDAVMNSSDVDMRQETRRPPATSFHMNHYQHGTLGDLFLDGGASGGDWELDVETTEWGANATHYTIDDLGDVRTRIQGELMGRVQP